MRPRLVITLLITSVVALSLCYEGCEKTQFTNKATLSPDASLSATFYCNASFTGTFPSYLSLGPTVKAPLYVGSDPKHYRLAVHDPTGATTIAILNGATTVPIPHIPASVDVEAAKIEIQNNGAATADTCYEYIQQ